MSGPWGEEAAFRLGITITRVFDAARERVWHEWTEPEAFADWFGAADGRCRCTPSGWTSGREAPCG